MSQGYKSLSKIEYAGPYQIQNTSMASINCSVQVKNKDLNRIIEIPKKNIKNNRELGTELNSMNKSTVGNK